MNNADGKGERKTMWILVERERVSIMLVKVHVVIAASWRRKAEYNQNRRRFLRAAI